MTGTPRPARKAPPWDPPITVGLLIWGVITTIQTVAQARDLPDALSVVLTARGLGPYTQPAFATAVGWVIVAEAVLSLALAIGFAVPRLREHKIAFWVPIAAAAVSGVLTVVLIMVAVAADPTVLAALEHGGGTP